MYKKTSRVAIAAASVLALAFGAAAYAADSAPPPPDGPHGGPGMHHHGHHGGPLEVFKRLHAQLKLTPAQEQQYQAAEATTKQNRDAMRKNFEQSRSQFDAAQSQPILDLDAMQAARDQVFQQNAQLHQQTEKAWLAFYDGLTDAQKTQVSTALKADFAKMKARHEKMKAHWAHRHAEKAAAASAPAQ
ncbi:periplasmic heavy metal sensor [Burkholderia sp. Ac-20379]|uniref:periplasmic heavy metal sensor n=1 Tax=Burkholderia sp. Ac-20379 TaxID=2703900 RepID=UPI00197CD1D7|nr:periplasmic heavy metal sensor [Burkholderia sp. Ac-20379]MBN3725474.1 periplasmic heavy metal sensor [Burkholderia sp. Ac-20379]